MDYSPIQLKNEFSKIKDLWSPQLIAKVNNQHYKIVKIDGDFEWHDHEGADKVFFVLDGEMFIDFRNGQVKLSAGEMFVVSGGVEHKPSAKQVTHIMLIEPDVV